MECKFCNKKFCSKSSLNNHQKTAKYCIKLQDDNLEIISNFNCEFCNKNFTTKQVLLNHLYSCKNKIVNDKFQDKDKDYKEQLKEKDILIMKLKLVNDIYKDQIKDLQNKIDVIVNKAIDKPTTTNNTINNKIELNSFPSQLEIDRKIESQFNDKYLWDGMKGVAQFVYDHIIKLEDGSVAYACFDTSRQMFKYKDQDGNDIKDPKAFKLRKMIKPGLLRQSQSLLDYFSEECDYLEKRKNKGLNIDRKEYNTMNTLREKAFEVGCEILNIDETSKFSNELATLSCV
jgi:hypothetical protein